LSRQKRVANLQSPGPASKYNIQFRPDWALLKILALGNQQVAQGRVKPLAEVVKRIHPDEGGLMGFQVVLTEDA